MKKTKLFLGVLLASATLALASCDTKSSPSSTSSTPSSTTTSSQTSEVSTTVETTTESTTTTPEVEYSTVYYCEGASKTSKTVISEQEVIMNKPLLAQITAPEKDGYRILSYRLNSSITGEIITEDYIIEKESLLVFVEYEKIDNNSIYEHKAESSTLTGMNYYNSLTSAQQNNFFSNGYVDNKLPNFGSYEGTDAYVKVDTAEEFINALLSAKIDYTSEVDEVIGTAGKIVRNNVRKNETNWISAITKGLYLKNNDGTYTKIPADTPYSDTTYTADMTYYEDSNATEVSIKQTLNKEATVHVIELTGDIDLGYYKLDSSLLTSGIVESYSPKYDSVIKSDTAPFSVTSMLKESGISKINISKTNNLLIYSKNGAKITHAGFSVKSCDGLVFRNIEMDELWQWEDSASATPTFTVGDMDVFGWAYFKISFSGYIWIDHCTFGKSYDGQIDVSNPYFYSIGTASSAPYGKPSTYTESNSGGVHISNCKFQSGSDDPDGYLCKMMAEIEADYQKSLTDTTYSCKYLYYKTLRDKYNLSPNEILYGVAIPQKKAFLLGDSSESKTAATYHYNQALKVSFANNLFIDIEDRIPNVRGGIAYLANCVVDNSRYFKYRTILQSKGAGAISSVNSKYKLALVSQGIIGGYGASICAENCLFIGVSTLVKNNSKEYNDITTAQLAAGYKLINCMYYPTAEADSYDKIINSDTDTTYVKPSGDITTANFNWHNGTNEKPNYDIKLYDVETLVDSLYSTCSVGTNPNFDSLYLTVNYQI